MFWVSTVRADGRPHVTPVVAVWAEEALWLSTGASEQKFANMRANPHVVMIAGPNRWDGGLDVVVEGEGWRFTARGGAFRDPDGSGEAMAISVTPVTVRAHAKGDPFGQTTYRFRRD